MIDVEMDNVKSQADEGSAYDLQVDLDEEYHTFAKEEKKLSDMQLELVYD